MEALLRKLEENQQMTDEAANRLKPNKAAPTKYVSLFCVDGEPILPPLMTSPKRREMRKLKEEAIKVEQRLKEKRLQSNVNCETEDDEASVISLLPYSGNVSQESHDFFEAKRLQAEASMITLQNIIERQRGGGVGILSKEKEEVCYTSEFNSTPDTIGQRQSKLQKLQKSETFIYDINKPHGTKIIVLKEDLEPAGSTPTAKFDSKAAKKSLYLSLSKSTDYHGNIPIICVKPPTPLKEQGAMAATRENDSRISGNISQDFTALDETADDQSPKISERIRQFEAISSRSSSSRSSATTTIYTATTPNSSPEKDYRDLGSPEVTLKPPSMNRSATSPSLKHKTQQQSSPPLPLSTPDVTLPENELVRSSSFTLEEPSKALIDHMRQQKQTVKNNTKAKVFTVNPRQSQSRLTQDTVESKAKKVYKLEAKTSRTKIQTKSSSTSVSTFYNSGTATFNSTSSTNVYKNKRSPYEPILMRNSSANTHQSNIKQNMRKVSATSTNSVTSFTNKQIRTRQSLATMSSSRQNLSKSLLPAKQKTAASVQQNINAASNVPEALAQLDCEKKSIFLQLLAQQEEEKQKLHKAFEMQQKWLLEQLNQKSINSVHADQPHSARVQSQRHHQQQPQNHISPLNSDTATTQRDYSSDSTLQSTHRSPPLSCDGSPASIADIATLPESSFHRQNNTLGSTESFPSMEQYNAMRKSLSNSASNNHLNNTTITTKALKTPRRRLFVQDVTALSARGLRNGSTQPGCSDRHFDVREAAATKINAFVRGFLVRRLFQTEHIQRIVQTIRDTLIFVLNLHIESWQNPREALEPSNIKLKGRLLQQLYSATRSLHLLFFQTTIKERMNIIAQDRKRLQVKLSMLHKKG